MIDELKCIFKEPTIFKGIKIYPILMSDYNEFMNSIGIFTVNKNVYTDINIIRMSYLDFIWNIGIQDPMIIRQLNSVLSLSLRNQIFKFNINEKGGYDILVYPEEVNEETIDYYNNPISINGYEFNELRKIILEQNLIPYDDTIVDAEVLKTLNDALEYIRRKNKTDTTIQDKIIAYHCYTGKDYEEIKNMSIYQFEKSTSRIDFFHILQLYINACASGNLDSKELDSWDKHIPNQGLYDAVMIKGDEANDLLSGIEDFNNF